MEVDVCVFARNKQLTTHASSLLAPEFTSSLLSRDLMRYLLVILKRAEVYFIYSFNWERLAKFAKKLLVVSVWKEPSWFSITRRDVALDQLGALKNSHNLNSTSLIVVPPPRLCAMFRSVLSAEILRDVVRQGKSLILTEREDIVGVASAASWMLLLLVAVCARPLKTHSSWRLVELMP